MQEKTVAVSFVNRNGSARQFSGAAYLVFGFISVNYVKKKNLICPFRSVFWRFLLFPIRIGTLFSDRMHKLFIKGKPVATAFRFG